MARKRTTKLSNQNLKKLTVIDVMCPICKSILIEPITLPCTHSFCSSCLETTTTQTSNSICPICKIRIASFLRSSKKDNKTINSTLWKTIQEDFPTQIENKLKTIDKNTHDDTAVVVVPSTSSIRKSSQDFAKKEYTCRILCQNSIDIAEYSELKRLKRLQKTANSDSDEPGDSIESQCIYFRPIDYRNNPPAQKYAPIKVPARRPTSGTPTAITPPAGRNAIVINHLESAFARLLATETRPEEIVTKRKVVEAQNVSKRLRRCARCAAVKCECIDENYLKLLKEEAAKKLLQEKADYEFALRLQEQLNRTSKYSMRSRISKRQTTSVAGRRVVTEVK